MDIVIIGIVAGQMKAIMTRVRFGRSARVGLAVVVAVVVVVAVEAVEYHA